MMVAAIYLVPQPLLFIPLADVINRLDLGNTLTAVILTYPTMLVPFCLAIARIFQDCAEGTGGSSADRRR